MTNHPTPEQVERFARGETAPEENRLVVLHFLRGCPDCQKLALAALRRTGSEPARLVPGRSH